MKMENKNGSTQIGFAIIVLAVLLFFGSIFVDDTPYKTKSSYIESKNTQDYASDSKYPEDNYLFFLNETDIGKQKKVTQSYPNIALGSKKEYNSIHLENNFRLNANPFTSNDYSFNVNFEDPQDVKSILLYFNPSRVSGDQDLVIYANGMEIYRNKARSNEVPLIINQKFGNATNLKFELDKPHWYSFFNWNRFEIEELKIIEVRQDNSNNEKEFSFLVEKDFLERVELNIVVDCDDETDSNKPIRVEVNGFTIDDFNPDCTSSVNRAITREIPLNIISSESNELVFKTEGYYELAYSLNKIFFNDQDVYKFTVNNFNDVIDIIMYGDFDAQQIDFRLNSQTMTLRRDEIKSIIPYIRYGTNELKVLTKPVEIKELIIEKNDFYY
ncbi:MAG: hypothetical protein PF569_03095 [Candidatus Woesearchaeota archaeon]|jgi:hypothetical protein|nr:hypothetical protein [Candidatus Woesearchaeota archaeon]